MLRKRVMAGLAAIVVAGGLLGACEHPNRNQIGGTMLGGAVGGLAGSQIGGGSGRLAATAAGALLGAWLGNSAGQSLDRADRQAATTAHTEALSTGQQIRWNNPDSGHYGTVTPTRDGRDVNTGAYCREFQSQIVVGGQTQNAYGTACQQPDGSWRIVDQR